MSRLDLRIVRGARAGQSERFTTDTITVGRNPGCSLRFDATRDVDASGMHAEMRRRADGWVVVDRGSTNGTFVNGRRVTAETPISVGDRIDFGAEGPAVEIVSLDGPPAVASRTPRPSTEERVAVAVAQQTRKVKGVLVASVLTMAVIAGAGLWLMQRQTRNELEAIRAAYDASQVELRQHLSRLGDTAAIEQLQRRSDSLRARLSGAQGNSAAMVALRAEVERNQVAQQGLVAMSRSEIAARNGAAVALLMVNYGDERFGGTAFGITPEGLLVTNRHNVDLRNGRAPTRLLVKFANTDIYRRARIVKVSESSDVDLALVQIEEAGRYPTVVGVSAAAALRQGDPLAILGFPDLMDLPMDGVMARTSLNAALVSKRAPGILQIDSYAAHGSSGSPVFDSLGVVVGVVYGGDPRSQGRIIFAVPGDRVVSFLPPEARTIVRP